MHGGNANDYHVFPDALDGGTAGARAYEKLRKSFTYDDVRKVVDQALGSQSKE